MTRLGMNPARHRLSRYRPARVTVAVLVYLPHLTGYFAHRLDVVRLSLASLLRHTDPPYDLMLFDNGSCAEVKAYLQQLLEQGAAQFLVASHENLGKLAALRLIAASALGEVVAYADDDTFFYPGWLPAHLEILERFPRVGMVSGSPERTLFDHGVQSTLGWARSHPSVVLTRGKSIPEEWERDWALALGKEPAGYLDQVRQMEDVLLEWDGVGAYATACHNQFVAPKAALSEILQGEWPERLMGGLNEFDNAVDAAGYLRLTTVRRTTRLIGNVVGRGISDEAERLGIPRQGAMWMVGGRGRRSLTQTLVRVKPIRWVLQGIYNRLFQILTGQPARWAPSQEASQGRKGETGPSA